MSSMISVLLLLLLVVYPNSAQGTLKIMSQCVCPEHSLSYECTVEGDSTAGATVWSGTAFDCTDLENELTFIHIRRFTETSLGCNDGAIVGRGVKVMGNNYTSQINITVEHSMEGKTVMCSYNNGSIITVVGNTSISLTKVPLPPPTDVSVNITDVLTGPLRLTFKWSPVAVYCTAIRYITEFDCGSCPNTTDDTEVVCSDIMIGSQCRFTVQTQVCDSVTGNVTVVPITLKVPEPPAVCELIPTYSQKTGNLTAVTLVISDSESFDNISDTISGSRTYYSLELTESDSVSEAICFSTNISSSLFVMDSGSYTFNYNSSLSECYNNTATTVKVKVSATNVLGSGEAYNETLELSNHFVEVTYSQNFSTVYCRFYTWASINIPVTKSEYNCSIKVNYGFNKSEVARGTTLDSNSVTLHLESTSIPDEQYHFTVTASSDNYTVYVEGIFKSNGSILSTKDPVLSHSTAEILVYTLIAIVISMGIVVVVVLGLVCFSLKNKLRRDKVETKNTRQPMLQSSDLSPRERTSQTDRELNDSRIGIYSLLQPTEDEKLIYADIGPLSGNPHSINLLADDRVEYAELNHQHEDVLQYQDPKSKSCQTDKSINLDNMLIQLRNEVTEKWYEFGMALGMSREVMEKYKGHSSDQCIIEVLDYWLRHHPHQPTWREVAQALDVTGLCELSNKISQVYVTGSLPIEVGLDANIESVLHHKDQPPLIPSETGSGDSPPPLLPPKGYN